MESSNQINEGELYTSTPSIQNIFTMYKQGQFRVNRRYQRKLVWTLEEKQRLIESVMKEYPIPALILSRTPEGNYEIIDGMQRLHTIISYMEQKFPNLDGKYFNAYEHLAARNLLEKRNVEILQDNVISREETENILNYNISISTVDNATPARIDDVFSRINSYGHRLSDQERRQAGVINPFADFVRDISALIRQESSNLHNVNLDEAVEMNLDISDMDKISVQLPSAKMGYAVNAGDTLWVKQGVLNATDLRDSEDEQCIADISAGILLGAPLRRERPALDDLYRSGSNVLDRCISSLAARGEQKFKAELLFVLDEITKISKHGEAKLAGIIYEKRGQRRRNSNPISAQYALLVMAVYELVFKENKEFVDYAAALESLRGIADNLKTYRDSVTEENRKYNIGAFKVRLEPTMHHRDTPLDLSPTGLEIESIIRSSPSEWGRLEFKQGYFSLAPDRKVDKKANNKIVNTISAIANIPTRSDRVYAGYIIIGIADKDSDAKRIAALDSISPVDISYRKLVGISREYRYVTGQTAEEYFHLWRDLISNSGLEPGLKSSVLNEMQIVNIDGVELLVIAVPVQKEINSVVDSGIFVRQGDQTRKLTKVDEIIAHSKNFEQSL